MSMTVLQLLIAAGLLTLMFMAVWLGQLFGRRRRRFEEANDPHLGIVQGAVLALLGLLLGFSYSGASNRFMERQDVLVREANAIKTAYLRCDLLAEPHASRLREELRKYTDLRLELFARSGEAVAATTDIKKRLSAQQHTLWTAATAAASANPGVTMAILDPINAISDLLALRNAATLRHIPVLVAGVVMACAFASLGGVGYVLGLSGRPLRGLAVLLVLLISSALWVTIDLDFPRHGLIRINDQPLIDLRDSLHPGTKP